MKKKTDDIFARSRKKDQPEQRNRLLKAGAFLLVALTLGVLGYFLLREQNFSPPVSILTSNSIRRILLPDSSKVVLSRNSELTYPKSYKGDSREVYLKGEAFFDVTSNEEKPFIVHTSKADIKVVGTAFNVQANEGRFEVGVAEGKVLVSTATDSSYLAAGYSATLAGNAASLGVTPNADANAWGYATRKFVFKNASLPDVFDCIEKSTAYTFQVKNKSIENCKITATFEDVAAEDMVNLIAESLNLTVTQNDYVFVLQGEGCP